MRKAFVIQRVWSIVQVPVLCPHQEISAGLAMSLSPDAVFTNIQELVEDDQDAEDQVKTVWQCDHPDCITSLEVGLRKLSVDYTLSDVKELFIRNEWNDTRVWNLAEVFVRVTRDCGPLTDPLHPQWVAQTKPTPLHDPATR